MSTSNNRWKIACLDVWEADVRAATEAVKPPEFDLHFAESFDDDEQLNVARDSDFIMACWGPVPARVIEQSPNVRMVGDREGEVLPGQKRYCRRLDEAKRHLANEFSQMTAVGDLRLESRANSGGTGPLGCRRGGFANFQVCDNACDTREAVFR